MNTPRQIIFKAKRKDNGEWVEGYYSHREWVNGNRKNLHYIHGEINAFHYFQYEIDSTTLSQFTGLYDKNKNKIWESDVIKTKYGRLCIVKWYSSDSYCGWDLEPIDSNENLKLKPPSEYFLWCNEDNEVVGNIFDNPEMIDGETE
jgi:uncharacterized phage protein (TIGR01671 family)